MGALKNIKHEKFAQGIALGKPQDAAYVDAGYKSNPPNATRLIRNDKVKARIADLAEGAAKRSAKTLDDVIAAYERIAFFQLGELITLDEDGNPRYDLSKCSKDQIGLMQVEESTRRIVRKKNTDIAQPDEDDAEIVIFTVKPPDRLKALEKLGSYLGMGDTKTAKATDSLAQAIIAIAAHGGNTAPMRKPKNAKK